MDQRTDSQLLRAYGRERSESAFAELARRHVDAVHSTALRTVRDPQLAEDVTQAVFIALARQAAQLEEHQFLAGWLHRTTRNIAAQTVRTEARRRAREQEAAAMNAPDNEPPDAVWNQVSPLVDEGIETLGDADRDALLLRYFERKSAREMAASLGISEEAAQRRVGRAVERLRAFLARRGITVGSQSLALVMAANVVQAAPAGLASGIGAAVAGASGGGMLSVLARGFASAKLPLATVGAAIALVAFLFLRPGSGPQSSTSPAPEPAPGATALLPSPPPSATGASAAAAPVTAALSQREDDGVLLLKLISAATEKPVGSVEIACRRWVNGKYSSMRFITDRQGVAEIRYPKSAVLKLDLTTQQDGYADKRLRWDTKMGDVVPASYTARLGNPLAIGGTVVDADGLPVIGAKVGWNHMGRPQDNTRPEGHEFFYISTTTDAEGRWRINRIAPELVPRIHGSAEHPEHARSALSLAEQDAGVKEALAAETHVLRLGRGAHVSGHVVDEKDVPIPGANVMLGRHHEAGTRETTSGDFGNFYLIGCRLGTNVLSAEADGFTTTTILVEVTTNNQPFKLVLRRGNILRLRVVNQDGQPVPKAGVFHQTRPEYGMGFAFPQAQFGKSTDANGRLVWSNAPPGELEFNVHATGHMMVSEFIARADGQEHEVVMGPALVVSGTVRDADTGGLIPNFRITSGFPQVNPATKATNYHWSTLSRFWLNFSGGAFRHSFEEGVLGGNPNPGYVLKFTAEGYAPFVSRVLRPDEGEVRLDIALKKGEDAVITVVRSDLQPAANVEVALVSRGDEPGVRIKPGGIDQSQPSGRVTVLKTDASGRFGLPPDEQIEWVVFAGEHGYGSFNEPTVRANPLMVGYGAWGRLEGVVQSDGTPASGIELTLQYPQNNGARRHCRLSDFKAVTGADGRFVFPKVPWGELEVARWIPMPQPNAPTAKTLVPIEMVNVLPGETSTVTITNLEPKWPWKQ